MLGAITVTVNCIQETDLPSSVLSYFSGFRVRSAERSDGRVLRNLVGATESSLYRAFSAALLARSYSVASSTKNTSCA
jgi:hypothetical protein